MLRNRRFLSKAITCIALVFLSFLSFDGVAQTESINYQAVLRDANGNIKAEQTGSVTFKILRGSANGTEIYEETHMVTTNKVGLFNVRIGTETPSFPLLFKDIDWSAGPHFLNVVVDFFGVEDLGTTELVSVPYALYAKSSGDTVKAGAGIQVIGKDSIINTGDLSETNELISRFELLNDTALILHEGSNRKDTLSLTSLLKADSLKLEFGGNDLYNLSIIGGNQITFSVQDDDADAQNEIQFLSLVPTANGDSIALSNNGGGFLVSSLGISDNQQLSLSGNTLNLSGDTPSSVDLTGILGVDSLFKLGDSALVIVNANAPNDTLLFEGNTGDVSATNELIDSLALNNDVLEIYENGLLSRSIDLDSLGNSERAALAALISTNASDIAANTAAIALNNDTSASNELITETRLDGNELQIIEAGDTSRVDLSLFSNSVNNDNDSDNERIDSLSLSNDFLKIYEGGQLSDSISLNTFRDTAAITTLQNLINANAAAIALNNDTSSTNELITDASMVGDSLQVIEAGDTTYVNLSQFSNVTSNDDDSDNERIDSLALNNDVLEIYENGLLSRSIDLDSLGNSERAALAALISTNASDISTNQTAIAANATGIIDSTNNLETALLARINADSLLRYINDTTLDGQLRDSSATLRALITAAGSDDQAIDFSVTGDSIVLEDGGFVDITYINDSIANYNARISANQTAITNNQTALLARINADSLSRYMNDTTLDGQLRDSSATLRALITAAGSDDQAIAFSTTGDSIVLEDGGFVDITYINDSIANYNARISANQTAITNNQTALLARINADSLSRYMNDTTLDGQLRDSSATLRALITAAGSDDQAIDFSVTGDSIVLEDGGFVDITYINDSIANYNARISANQTAITNNQTALLARINADSLSRYMNDTTLDGQLRDSSATLRALITAAGSDDQAIAFSTTGDSIVLEDGGFVDITYINDSIANYNARISANQTAITNNQTALLARINADSLSRYMNDTTLDGQLRDSSATLRALITAAGSDDQAIAFSTTGDSIVLEDGGFVDITYINDSIANYNARISANQTAITNNQTALLARINADSLSRYMNDTTLDGQLRDSSATLRALITAAGSDDQAIDFSVTGDSIVLEDGGFVDITYINDSIANYNARISANQTAITNNQTALLARINADSLSRYMNDTTLDGQLRDSSATLRALITAAGSDDQAIAFSTTGDSIVLEDGGFVDITYINDSIANYNARISANQTAITNNQTALLARINADSLSRYMNDTTLDGQLRDSSATLRALITAAGSDDQAIAFSTTGDSIVLEDGGFVDITYINDSIANYNARISANQTAITNNQTALLARINADSLSRYMNDTTLDGQLRDSSATLRALITAAGSDDQAIAFSTTGDSIVLEDGGFVDITYINDSIANYNARISANQTAITNNQTALLARINADSLSRYMNDTTLDGQLRDSSATLRALITAAGSDDQAIDFSVTGDSIVLEDGGFVDITYINDSIANYNARISANQTAITNNQTALLARINADSLSRYMNDTTLDGQLRDSSATLRALITAAGSDDQAIDFSVTGDSIVLEDGGFVDISYINDSIANYDTRINNNASDITTNAGDISTNQTAIAANATGIIDSTNNLETALLARINADSLLRYINDTTLDGQLRDSSATLRALISAAGSDDQAIDFSVTGDSIVLEDGGFVDISYINDSIANYDTRINNNASDITTNAGDISTNQTAISANATGIIDSTNNLETALLARINADSLLRYINDTTLDGQLRDSSATLRALISAAGSDDQAIAFSTTGDSIVLEDGGFVDISYINDSIANYNTRIATNASDISTNQLAISANATGIIDSTNNLETALLARINADSLLRYINDTTLDGQLRDSSATLRALISASGSDDQAIAFSVTGDTIVLEDGGFVDITYINDSIANYDTRINNNASDITTNAGDISTNQTAISANATGIIDSTNNLETALLARINADSLLRYINDTTLDGQLRDSSATLRALISASGSDDQAIAFSVTGDTIVLEDGGFVDISYINDSIANYDTRINNNASDITTNAGDISTNQTAIAANATGIIDSTNNLETALLARINADSLLRYINDTTLDGQLRDSSATLRALISAAGSDDQAIAFSTTGDSIVLEDGGFVDISYINDSIANYNTRIATNASDISTNQLAISANATGIIDSTNNLETALLARINADSLLRYINDTTLDGQLRDSSATLRALISASGSDDQAIAFSVTGDTIVLEDGGFVDITYINDSIANYDTRINNNASDITTNAGDISTNQTAISANATGIIDSTNNLETALLARINADSLLRYINDTTLDGQLRDSSATLRALISASGSDDQAIAFSVTGDTIVLEDGGFVDISYINDSIANYDTRINNNASDITTNAGDISTNQTAIAANATGIIDSTNNLETALLARINADSLLRYINDTTLDGQLRDSSATLRALISAAGSDDQAIAFSTTGDSIVLEDGGFVDISYINDSIANYNTRIATNASDISTNQLAISANATGIIDSTNNLETALLARINTDSLLRYINDTTLDGQLRDSSATLRALISASGSDDQAIAFSTTGDTIVLEDGGFVDITYINDSIANYNARINNNASAIATNASDISTNQTAIAANATGIIDSTNNLETALLARINADSLLRYINDTTLDGQLRDSSATLRALITASGSDDQAIDFSVTGDTIVLEDGGFVDITYINDSIANYNARINNNASDITTNAGDISTNQTAIAANATGIIDSANNLEASLLARINADSLARYMNDTTLDGQLRDSSATLRALISASGSDDQAIDFSVTGDSIVLEDGGFVDITYINDSITNYNARINNNASAIATNASDISTNQSAISANATGIIDSTNNLETALLARINADSLLRYINDTTLDGQLRDSSATLRALISASGSDDQVIAFSVTGDTIVLEDGGFVDISYINDSIANYNTRIATNASDISTNQLAISANATGIIDSTNNLETALLARINADSLLRYINDTTLDGQLRDSSATLRALITASGSDDQSIDFSVTGDSIVLEDGGFVDITYINDSITNYNARINNNASAIATNASDISTNQSAISANATGIIDSTNNLETALLARINADSLLRYINDTTLDGQLRDSSATLRGLINNAGDDLGDHTLDSNLRTNGFYLSSDGDDEGIFIDSSGNIGLGTVTPFSKLQIVDTINTTGLRISALRSGSSWNRGIIVNTQNATNNNWGVLSTVGGGTGTSISLAGYADAQSAGQNYGVYGLAGNGSTVNVGVFGNTYDTVGVNDAAVWALAEGTGTRNVAVKAEVTDATNQSGTSIALLANASGADTNYAAYFESGLVYIADSLWIPQGAGDGKVLTSDQFGKARWENASTLVSGDNLGNHTLDSNLRTNGSWISNDGDDEGLSIDANGGVAIGYNGTISEKFFVSDDSVVTSGGYESVRFQSAGTNTSGAFQRALSTYISGTDGINTSLFGVSNGASVGTNRGLTGQADSAANNTGVYGVALATPAGANFAIGVSGGAFQTSDGINYGMYGSASNSSFINRGVVGVITDTVTTNDAAVYGIANGIGDNISIYGRANFTNPAGINYGSYFRAFGAGTNYAVYADTGNVYINDTLILNTGNPSAGQVLTAIDSDGTAKWEDLSNLSGSSIWTEYSSNSRAYYNQKVSIGGISSENNALTVYTDSLASNGITQYGESSFFNTLTLRNSDVDQRTSIGISNSASGNNLTIGTHNGTTWTNPFQIELGAPTNALRVDTLGRIGLGIAAPTSNLQIVGGNDVDLNANSGMLKIGEETGSHMIFDENEIQAKDDATTAGQLLLQPDGGEVQMRGALGGGMNVMFSTDNKIGLGTYSPTESFTVERPTGGGRAGVYLKGESDGFMYSGLILGNIIDDRFWEISYRSGVGEAEGLLFQRRDFGGAYVQHLFIDSTGSMGVGTLAPAAKLDVAGNIKADTIQIVGGTLGAGKVLTDVNGDGKASWQTAPVAVASDSTRIAYRTSEVYIASDSTIRMDYQGSEKLKIVGNRLEFINNANTINIGFESGLNYTAGSSISSSMFIGTFAGRDAGSGIANTAIGFRSGQNLGTGGFNTFLGYATGITNTGQSNVFIGAHAGNNVATGDGNVYIGTSAGDGNNNGSNNVFIGKSAGNGSTNLSDALIINNGGATPLIYGDFANDSLKVFGTLSVGDEFSLPTTDGTANQIMKTDGSGTVTFVDASTVFSSTDDQNLSVTADSIKIENGTGAYIGDIRDSLTAHNTRVLTNRSDIATNATAIGTEASDRATADGALATRIVNDSTRLNTIATNFTADSTSLVNHLAADGDLSATNELQDLTINAAADSILINGGTGVRIADVRDSSLTDLADSTVVLRSLITASGSDDQNLSVTADSIKIENGTGAYIGDIRDSLTAHNTRVLTNRSDIATNETAIGTEASDRATADGALATRIVDDSTRLNTIATNFTADSTSLVNHIAADGDLSATNELQDLSINGANDSLLLSNGDGVKLSDITSGISDDQNLSVTADSIKIENGTGAYIGDIRDSLTAHNTRVLTNRSDIATNATAISTEASDRATADGALATRIVDDSTRLNTIATNFTADSTSLVNHLAADGDLSATNELQDLSINGAADSILINGGTGVRIADVRDSSLTDLADSTVVLRSLITASGTDDQNLSVTADSIKIENGTGAYIGDIRDSLTAHNTRVLTNRSDIATNATAISTEASDRATADGALATRIVDDSTRLNTIATNFTADSTSLVNHIAADGDLSATNELQDLSINGANDSLLLSNGDGVKLSDITSGISDDQNLSVTADSIKIENGTGAYIGDIRDSLTAHNTRVLTNRSDIATNATAISTEASDRATADGALATRIVDDSTRLNTIATNFTADSTSLVNHLAADGDLSATNELQDLSINGAADSILINGGTGVRIADVRDSSLTDLADSTGVLRGLISAAGDDLGDHTATTTIELGGNSISNDGDVEGISVANDGQVTATPGTTGAGNTAILANGDIQTSGQGTGLYLSNTAIGITGNESNLGSLKLKTASSDRLSISANGNVNIATPSSGNALTVSGVTQTTNFTMTNGASNGSVLTSDATGVASWQTPTSSPWSENLDTISTADKFVGIGTSTPEGRFGIVDTLTAATHEIGIYNNIHSTNTAGNAFGFKNYLSGEVNRSYGFHSDVLGSIEAFAKTYGVFSNVTASGNGGSAADFYGGYFSANGIHSPAGSEYFGIYAEAIGSGASSENIGLWATASGGSTNFAGYFDQGNVQINQKLLVGGSAAGTAEALNVKGGIVADSIQLTDGAAVNYVLTSTDANGNTAWVDPSVLNPTDTLDIISDADEDTKITLDNGGDDDIIRITQKGTEFFQLDSGKIYLTNNNVNVYIGDKAGELSAFTGARNVGIGAFSLRENKGIENTAVGYASLLNNSTGGGNTAIGQRAMNDNQTGFSNTVLGFEALGRNISGGGNVALGFNSGILSTGSNNIFIGNSAGGTASVGDDKLYIENSNSTTPLIYGDFANDSLKVFGTLSVGNEFTLPATDGTANQIMKTDGSGTLSFVDASSLTSTDTLNIIADADRNTNIDINGSDEIDFSLAGTAYLKLDTVNNTGTSPTPRLQFLNSGNNVILGGNSGNNISNTGGNGVNNIIIGNGSGNGTTDYSNVLIGTNVGNSGVSAHNVAIGNEAAQSGLNRSVAIGALAGQAGGLNFGVAIGFLAGNAVTGSSQSVYIGNEAGTATTTGGNNTFVGSQSGNTNITGSNNVFLGFQSGFSETGSNKLYISNSNSTTPLIYGDFAEDSLIINGNLRLDSAKDGSGYTFPGLRGTNGQVLTSDGAGQSYWSTIAGDNLGNHTATTKLDLGTNALVGDGGTAGILINSSGKIGIGGAAQTNRRLYVSSSTDQYAGQFLNTISGQTNTSFGIDATSSGANPGGSNIGIKGEASGAGTNVGVQGLGAGAGSGSYSGYFLLGKFYVGDSVGIMNANPTAALDLTGRAKIDTLEVDGFYTFPSAAGGANEVLVNDGSGNVTWGAVPVATCPVGMTAAGASLCIETAERAASDWFDASAACVAAGYRLPTWSEWYGAAANAVLTDETDDWEWVSDGTSNTAKKVGNGGLKNSANDDPDTGSEAFRCVTYR